MIILKKARELDPKAFEGMSDEEAQRVLDDMYGFASLAFEKWEKDNRIGNIDKPI